MNEPRLDEWLLTAFYACEVVRVTKRADIPELAVAIAFACGLETLSDRQNVEEIAASMLGTKESTLIHYREDDAVASRLFRVSNSLRKPSPSYADHVELLDNIWFLVKSVCMQNRTTGIRRVAEILDAHVRTLPFEARIEITAAVMHG